jgi:two-component system response regulator FixJ
MQPSGKIYLVDDDPAVRDALGALLESAGYRVAGVATARTLLDECRAQDRAVVILDHFLDDLTGLELQAELKRRDVDWPLIFISGSGNVQLSVRAMKAGAMDFLEKPIDKDSLLACVKGAFARLDERERAFELAQEAQARCNSLSDREREVMGCIISGMSNSKVAEQLDLSIRTVEVHRANIKRKMGADTLAELVRLADLCQMPG